MTPRLSIPFAILWVATCLPNIAAALAISAEPIHATVVDEKGKPIGGVVVVADWDLRDGWQSAGGALMLLETTTNSEGAFDFPAWGPKEMPPDRYLFSSDPIIFLFKPGYASIALRNEPNLSRERVNQTVRKSEWNGKKIVLHAISGDSQDDADRVFGGVAELFIRVRRDRNCQWTRIPKMFMQAVAEAKRLSQLGVDTSTVPRLATLPDQDKCGSAAAMFEVKP